MKLWLPKKKVRKTPSRRGRNALEYEEQVLPGMSLSIGLRSVRHVFVVPTRR